MTVAEIGGEMQRVSVEIREMQLMQNPDEPGRAVVLLADYAVLDEAGEAVQVDAVAAPMLEMAVERAIEGICS